MLEKYNHNNGQRWKVLGNTLIGISENEYLVYGNKEFCEWLYEIGMSMEGRFTAYTQKRVSGVNYRHEFQKVRLNRVELSRLKAEYEIDSVDAKRCELSHRLPNIHEVVELLGAKSNFNCYMGSGVVDLFDFSDYCWERSDSGMSQDGLYRISDDYGATNYKVAFREQDTRMQYETKYGDWAVLIAMWFLDREIVIEYDESQQALSLSKDVFKVLPNLLRRVLIVQSFKWPVHDVNKVVFSCIDKSVVSSLVRKLPNYRAVPNGK